MGSNYQNDYVNSTQNKDIEYQYEGMMQGDRQEYQYLYNSSDSEDYEIKNYNENNISENIDVPVFNNDTNTTENHIPYGLGEIVQQYYEKLIGWISEISSCIGGNKPSIR